ncbi:hypothetical protein H650_15895 [Enterobacter sp. R4-368]|nr:hypothetical protein H650_15895 [Enterobacter sp. R4-368]
MNQALGIIHSFFLRLRNNSLPESINNLLIKKIYGKTHFI